MRAIYLLLGACGAAAACGGQTSAVGRTDAGGDGPVTLPPDGGPVPDATPGDAVADAPGPDARADVALDAPGPETSPPAPGAAFALHRYYLGDTTLDGGPSATAWESLGRNIDGLVTNVTSQGVCSLVPGSVRSTQADGAQGIDNSWGANLMPIFTALAPNVDAQMNAAIQAGGPTLLLDVTGLTGDLMQTSAATPGQLFMGTQFPGVPTWTTADDWPVSPAFLVDGKTVAGGSTVTFPAAGILAGAWASAPPGDLPVQLPFLGTPMSLVLHDAVVSFVRTSPTQVTGGVLSGVLTTSEFIAELRRVAGSVTTSLCSGSAFDSLAQQFSQASDILHDGTNTPGVTCDAISVGIGFTADAVGPIRTVGPQPVAPPEPCDAGGG